ncbi:MAG: nucleotidyltransferase family protein [Acidobacteriaceae bacterium]
MIESFNANHLMSVLSRLLLTPQSEGAAHDVEIAEMGREQFESLLALANLNHVTMRAMKVLLEAMRSAGDGLRAEWAASALGAEGERIENAVSFLRAICSALDAAGCNVTVIKSLDHWPDLGSDLDLYTGSGVEEVSKVMKRNFGAQLASRSWGDRLAGKWNFIVPGLPEPVEIHMGRLGQTGEQASIAASLPARSRRIEIDGHDFRVPSASDRLMVSTLQRMYRHFFFRLCDVVDTVELSESGLIDYQDLQRSAEAAGIWEGVATYLVIVSDYVERYREEGLNLPQSVKASARFGGSELYFRQDFLRVPILPQSASLYGLQLSGLLRKRELHSSARLSLLPWLATAAAVGQKLTGSDKGIW